MFGGALGWASADWPGEYPEVPTPDIEASDDPEVIARGEYVFHSVAHCTGCHTPKDELLELEQGEHGVPKGGFTWELGPIGVLHSANITIDPKTGVGEWTDGKLARAIRHAVKRDDTPAFMMVLAGMMSDEDLHAVVSYMRTIDPVENDVPDSEITAVGRLATRLAMPIMATPRPASATPPPYVPAGETSVERGEYLSTGPAMCVYCHTELDLTTAELAAQPFSGGPPEPDPLDPEMEIAAPNLTTGGRLAEWDADAFVARMRAARVVEGSSMPWENFRGMTDEDLRSIFLYLKSVEPSDNDPGPNHRTVGWTPDS